MKNKRAKPVTVDPTLTLKEIDQQIARLKDQAAHIVASEKSGVVERIKDAIAYYGITAADLGFGGPGKPPTNAAGPAKRGKAAKAAAAGEPANVPESTEVAASSAPQKKGRPAGRIKFKDDAGNTWSGYGPKPKWFVAALASGKTPQDLAA